MAGLKTVTYTKISPRMVKPSWECREEEGEDKDEDEEEEEEEEEEASFFSP